MLTREDVVEQFNEWMTNLENALNKKDGNDLSESTRMVLAFALILHAYFPDTLTYEIGQRMKELFAKSLACVTEQLDNGINPDGCYDLYQRNIHERLEKLEELGRAWWTEIPPSA